MLAIPLSLILRSASRQEIENRSVATVSHPLMRRDRRYHVPARSAAHLLTLTARTPPRAPHSLRPVFQYPKSRSSLNVAAGDVLAPAPLPCCRDESLRCATARNDGTALLRTHVSLVQYFCEYSVGQSSGY